MKRPIRSLAPLLALALAVSLFTAASAAGSEPVAENLELDTYRGVSVGGTLTATDPDGDVAGFEITTGPVKGSLDLDEDGRFVYTPAEGKRGKDYFGYRAFDAEGNRSQEATVIIRIRKQSGKVNYSDTAGRSSAYAAVRLAEEGIFTGEMLGGEYVFSPDRPVTRQEFLAMCLPLSDAAVLSGVRATGFADDRDIADWARPYVATALSTGVISGYAAEDGAVFEPERNISVLEAAVILDRTLGLTDAVAAWFGYDGALPAWGLQAASNVSSCGLLPYGCSYTDGTLSRGAAAEMLVAAMDVVAKR